MEKNKLFLLDAYALIFRAYYAFIKNPRITSYGLNSSAIFGFTNSLWDILDKQKPSHIAVVFDHKSQTFRAQEFDFYKANRDETPEDIKKSEPYIREVIKAFNIPILEAEGYEADDVIGTLAKIAEKENFEVMMMTPDKDFGQLVTENIKMYKPGRMGKPAEIWGPAEINKKFDIDHPLQVIDILGLMGDAVDNIPGVPGVGPKTASKLISQYGSMEDLYQNLGDLKGKLKENLENNQEQAFISKRLATIALDAPVDFNPKSLEKEEPNADRLRELFTELEFRNLNQRILGDKLETATGGQRSLFDAEPQQGAEETVEKEILTLENVKHNYILVETAADRKALVTELQKSSCICFDTETTGLDPIHAEILGLAFSTVKGKAWYVSCPKDFDQAKALLHEFDPIWQNKNVELVAQNYKYDFRILLKYGIEVTAKIFDTMLAHYLIEPDQRHGMDELAEKYLNYKPMSITELIGKKGKNQATFDTVPLDKATEYAGEDADITLQLKHVLEPELEKMEVKKVFDDIEVPLINVLGEMENEGVFINSKFLEDYSEELESEAVELEKKVYEVAGEEFNLASPKQLGLILFDKLKLDSKAKKTKSGQYKTDEETLSKLANKHELPQMILDFRQLQKLKSTYVDALPKLVNPITGKVHTTFSQAVAATGRLSSNNPNLQNIPIRTEKGRYIRKAFVPSEKDHILLAADYSQIELRIIASISEDKAMMEAFNNGLDIHAATAAKVFGVDLDHVDSDMRRKAKTVNFGIIYGISAFGLSQRVNISRTEAKEIIDAYFEQFSGIKNYMDETIDFCRKHGYVKTLMGRKRYIRDINSNNRTVVGFAERNAINAPIQGSAADMIKIAMIRVQEKLKASKLKAKMILQVHDELLFDLPVEEKDELIQLVLPEMEKAMELKVPVKVEYGSGKDWLEAH